MKKGLALFLVGIFLLSGCASVPVSKKMPDNFLYEEEPEICFFPKDQAIWDGYKITNKNWNKLSDYLKLMFVFEGVQELQRKNRVNIALGDSGRTVAALDYGLDKISKDMPQVEIVVIDFLYDVLKQAKMVTPR